MRHVLTCCHDTQIYATVGTDAKRQFLTNNYGIPGDRIFSSRSTDFSTQLMSATRGSGVVSDMRLFRVRRVHGAVMATAVGQVVPFGHVDRTSGTALAHASQSHPYLVKQSTTDC